MLGVLSFYWMVTFLYFGIRFVLHRLNKPYQSKILKSFTIIVPVYREKLGVFKRCLDSCIKQLTEDAEIIVVHDGEVDECYNYALELAKKNPQIRVFHHERNKGKREAQATALRHAKGEFIVTIDSDTILEENAIVELLKPFEDEKIGAVTGSVIVANKDENTLTKLLNIRYFMAGIFDRGAYSYFKVVNCTSGPFSAYRKSVFFEALPEYLHQTHRGKRCTFGDDRHLTNLILRKGYGVFYQKTAKCKTYAPSDLKTWLKQQLRWSRSFWRESWYAFHWCWWRSKYLSFGLVMDCILPALFLANLIFALYQGLVTTGLFVFIPYLATASGMAYLRNFDYLEVTRKADYFIVPLYAVLYIFLLLPISIYALFTTDKAEWMTR